MRWLVPLGVIAVTLSAQASEAPSCGEPGKRPCPLQHWMRVNMAAPLAKGENEELAKAFETLEKINPRPGEWANWSKFSREGARAARAGNERGAEAECGHCHRVYRREYNARYRERKVSE